MKITVIAFDLWGYGKEISDFLTDNNYHVNYINTNLYQYKYKNKKEQIKNFFSKVFYKKNIKKINRDLEVLNHLKEKGDLGKVLIINPGEYHNFLIQYIKENSFFLVGWNYDSLKRKSINEFLMNSFDKIYSFDRLDCQIDKRIQLQTNYIIGEKEALLLDEKEFKLKAYIIIAYDKYRFEALKALQKSLKSYHLLFHIKYNNKKVIDNIEGFEWIKESLNFTEVNNYLRETEIFIDILRPKKYNQVGLSFRVFDAMRFQRKLITTNKDIVNYDFYNPNNIFVVEDLNNIKNLKSFIDNTYEPILDDIYNRYTLKSFCERVLELEF
ncbi:hypothetical protein ACTS94_04725 [Empedobacter falsenii]